MRLFKLKASPGSTLLLAILVMASISATAYVLSNVTLKFLVQARNIVYGEIVILASDAALEQALWNYNRTEGMLHVAECNDYHPAGSLNNQTTSLNHCITQFAPSPTDYAFERDEVAQYLLLNPRDPGSGAGYTELNFHFLRGWGRITLCSWAYEQCAPGFGDMINSQHTEGTGTVTVSVTPEAKYVLYLEGLNRPYAGRFEGRAWTEEGGEARGLPTDVITIVGRSDFAPFISRAQRFQLVPQSAD